MRIAVNNFSALRASSLVGLLFVALLGQQVCFAQTLLLDEVHTLAGGELPVDPIEKTLTIQTAGTYDVVLTDLKQPAALAAISLAVTRGSAVVTTASAPGTVHFDATPGTYVVRVVGALNTGASTGNVGVQIKNAAGGAVALEFVSPLQLQAGAALPNTRVLETDLSIAAAGDYKVTLTDLELPSALSLLKLSITPAGGSVAATLDAAGTVTFTASPGTYHLVAIGQADTTTNAGLFSVRVQSVATNEVLLSDVEPVANVVKVSDATLGAGARTLTLTDLAFPIALTQGAVVVEQNGLAVARLTAPGATPFTASAGTSEVFVLAVPATPPGTGTYGIDIRASGAAAEFSTVRTAGGVSSSTPAYSFVVDIPASGSYQIKLGDFQFPTPFAALSIAAVQDGTLAGTSSSAGSLSVTLTAGKVFIIVAAQPSPGAAALFGLSVAPATGGTSLFETTQGVGRSFSSRTISVTTAGQYDASLIDVGFPVNFIDLAAVVTRGAERFGSIINSGKFSFTATPGDYIISFLVGPAPIRAGAKQSAGTYGISVAPTPPPPVVTLTASAASVVKGQSVTLTWSSQGATSCTASKDWAGNRDLSGTEKTAALNAPATYTLECANDSGKTSQSVTVNVTAGETSGGGGGGSLDWLLLLLLSGVVAIRLGLPRSSAASSELLWQENKKIFFFF